NREPVNPWEIERQVQRLGPSPGEVDIVGQGVRNHLWLLKYLLLHEVPMVTLVDQIGRAKGLLAPALDLVAIHVENLEIVATQDRPIAVLEIGDGIGERREGYRVGAQEHLALAMADRQRRTVARADDQIFVVPEHDREIGRASCRERV